jgi:hypothetical protein
MNAPTGDDVDRYANLALYWGSRILAAILILLIAHFVAKAIKGLIAKNADKLPGVSHHNTHANKKGEPQSTVGSQLGDVGYWLVLLVGVIAALNVLDLQAVVEPLNGMLGTFLNFIPRIVGAVFTFFLGYILATLASRLVTAALEAANLDHWLDKLGLRGLTGASGLAKTVGSIVFALIIIPFAIGALGALGIAAISDPAIGALNQILTAIPRLILAAIILIIFYALGRWVASLVEQILPSFGFDKTVGAALGGGASPSPSSASSTLVSPTGETLSSVPPPSPSGATTPAAAAKQGAASMTPSKIVGQIALVFIVLFGAVQAANALQFEPAVVILSEILALFGRILFGGIIIMLGVVIAQFLSGLMSKSGGPSGQMAATVVKWAAIALSVAIGLRFMGLANEIVIAAFVIILGAGGTAAAIAFGIGGIQPARTLLEKLSKGGSQPPQP